MTEQNTIGTSSRWSTVWGILLIITGVLATGWPFFTAVAVSRIIAWLIVFAGVYHIIYAFHAKTVGSLVWDILVGLAYLAVGIYAIAHPLIAVSSLTVLLAGLFFVEGVLDIIGYFQMRHRRGAGWILLDGIVTAFVGALIWPHWPSSSLWALGTFVGVSMIVSGVARVMMSLASRRLAVLPT
jgi:uncharacterized membrane protein HdeD (DUF308 family)